MGASFSTRSVAPLLKGFSVFTASPRYKKGKNVPPFRQTQCTRVCVLGDPTATSFKGRRWSALPQIAWGEMENPHLYARGNAIARNSIWRPVRPVQQDLCRWLNA